MSRHGIVVAVSCALLAGLALPIATQAAAAPRALPSQAAPKPAPQPAPPAEVVNSWAVAPIGTKPGEPGSRPNLSYEVAPGAKIDDAVSLFNYGNTQLTFRIYATDAFNDPSGGFDLLTGDKQPTDVGSWVQLPQANITVKASTRIDLPFKLTVPPDARPGDHAAAILASSTVSGHSPDGKIVALDRRAGTRIYVRVNGPLQPTLAVEHLTTTYHAALNPLNGSVDVRYDVRNTGNVRLGAHQRLEVKSPFGKTMKKSAPPDLAEVLPGNSVTIRAHYNHVTAAVRVAGDVLVTPFPVGQAKAPATPVSRSGPTWAIPWALLALAAAACVAWQARKRYLARRQRRTASSQPARPQAPVAP